MKLGKKVAAAIIAGSLGVTVLAGVGTYAYFNSKVTSTANSFQSGKLTLTATRDDVPVNGPMFYVEDDLSKGVRGTGPWQPGMTVTRGMIITNTGTLPAKLENVYGWVTDTNGNRVSSASTEYRDTVKFANASGIKFTILEPASAQAFTNSQYEEALADLNNRVQGLPENLTDQEAIDWLNAHNTLPTYRVKDLYSDNDFGKFLDRCKNGSMTGVLINGGNKVVVQPQQSTYMAYIVQFKETNQEQNQLQNVRTAPITFGVEFRQNN